MTDDRAWRPTALQALGVAGMVFVTSLAGMGMRPDGEPLSVWFPATGVTFAALALTRFPSWPLLLAAVAVGDGVASLVDGRHWVVAILFGLSSCVEGVLGVGLFLRWRNRRRRLRTSEDYAVLVGAAVVAGAVTGVGVAAITVLLDGSFLTAWRAYMFAHPTGVLLLAPAVLVTGGLPPIRSIWNALEVAAQLLLLAGVTVFVFAPDQSLPLTFLPLLPLVWAAVRLGPRLVTLELLGLGLYSTMATLRGDGPFFGFDGSPEPVGPAVSLGQAFLVATAVALIPLSLSIQRRRAVTAALHEREELFRRTFDESLLGMVMLDVADEEARVARANAAFAAMLGTQSATLPGRSWLDLLVPDDAETARDAVRSVRTGRIDGWEGELRHRGTDGEHWAEVAMTPLPEPDGSIRQVSLQMVDVTERHAAQEQLRVMALHDSLTGLPNRALLVDRLEYWLNVHHRDGGNLAMMFCDLDEFKRVNDSAGHAVGDAVLVAVTNRITAVLRPEDTVSRIGGDEFVVLCPLVDGLAEAQAIGARLVEALSRPVVAEGLSYRIGISVGLTMSQPTSTVDSMLREADSAMYAAKRGGRHQVAVYSEDQQARVSRSARLEHDLRRAVHEGELRLHVQPVVDLTNGRIVAGEALVRWNDPVHGLRPPSEWMDVAENSSVIYELGEWVLLQACTIAAAWAEDLGADTPRVHVNVSVRQLDRCTLASDVAGALRRSGLAADLLVLELTETYLQRVRHSLRADFEALDRMGVRVAADDFGTGYSPLTRLTELPVHMLKIDQQFVAGMGRDQRARAVVQAVLGLGTTLGLQVVAEGVETPAQADELRRLGCTLGQGFLWSPPRPPDQFLALVRDSLFQGLAS